MTDAHSIETRATTLIAELTAAGRSISTAESCTGGWIAKSLTDISGSSECFGYGIVSYSNSAKESILGVRPATLMEHGAVSEAVVMEMADGVLRLSGSDYAVSVSGIAGPGGGSKEKPVGTVWFGFAIREGSDSLLTTEKHNLTGDRDAVRRLSVVLALEGMLERSRAANG